MVRIGFCHKTSKLLKVGDEQFSECVRPGEEFVDDLEGRQSDFSMLLDQLVHDQFVHCSRINI